MSVCSHVMNGDVAVITIDNPPINAGNHQVRAGLLEQLDTVAAHPGLRGVVIVGAGTNFYSGSDIKEFDRPLAPPQLPAVIEAIEALPVPVVAAISGMALGGGFELALGCDVRIADPSAVVGLPEVGLGIIPGAGGTVRLPRLVGAPRALELIATAARIDAAQAERLGILDAITHGDLITEAVRVAATSTKNVLADTPQPDLDIEAYAEVSAKVIRRGRNRPAVRAAVEAVRLACTTPARSALELEREVFTQLRESTEAHNLRYLFFAERTAAKSLKTAAQANPVDHVAVVGAGTMGASIAAALLRAGYRTTVVDSNPEALTRARDAIARATDGYDGPAAELVADLGAVHSAQVVIDAVFEDLTVKKDLMRRLDDLTSADVILASNTSYLDLDDIGSVAADPSRVAGLHFFNPADRNRLVEIVETAETSPTVLATLAKVASRLNKVAIRARVGEGFIANRIYSAYRAQCEFLLEDGCTPEQIDRALVEFGYAMGPFAVADMSGLDIAWARRRRLAATRHPRQRYVSLPDQLCEAGRLGRKTGAGWYDYSTGSARPDPIVADLIDAERRSKENPGRAFSDEEIVQCTITAMVAEAVGVIADGITVNPSDIDLAMVTGFAFPRHFGGPLKYAAGQTSDWVGAGLERNRLSCPITFSVTETANQGGVPAPVRDLLARL